MRKMMEILVWDVENKKGRDRGKAGIAERPVAFLGGWCRKD